MCDRVVILCAREVTVLLGRVLCAHSCWSGELTVFAREETVSEGTVNNSYL